MRDVLKNHPVKKQRPTIPVHKWKLAVHLAATRDIQNQQGTPAFACDCESCVSWRRCYKAILPEDLLQQLLRVGIDIEHPTDLYEFERDQQGVSLRVVFHAVGRVLEGPNAWKADDWGKILMYLELRGEPYLSLVVYPQKQSFDDAPVLNDAAAGELLRIDFRLEVPNHMLENTASGLA